MTTELALTESPTLRAAHTDRTEVLTKVGTLRLLPDDMHVTTEMVAAFYEVPVDTIKSVVEANAAELEQNGRRVLQGADLREFARPFGGLANLGLHPKARALALYTRRTVLLVGMLLRDSPVAKQVRQHLLNAEAEQQKQLSPAEYLVQQAYQLLAQERRLAEVEARVDGIEQRTGWCTALGYARREGLPTNHTYVHRLGTAAGRILRAAGEQPAKVHNELYGQVNSYPEWALSEAAAGMGDAA